MSWIESIMIIFGISFEIFAMIECRGSLVAKVKKGQLAVMCLIISALQSVGLGIGHFAAVFIMDNIDVGKEAKLGHIMAIAIFILLGIRLIIKGIRNEMVNERREEHIEWKKYLYAAMITSLYTIATGIATGFCGMNLLALIIMLVIITCIVVIAGMYTGYNFGYEQKAKAYICGAILLWCVGIDMIVRYCILA